MSALHRGGGTPQHSRWLARMRSRPGGSISSDVLRAAMTNQEAPAVGLVGLINSCIVDASNYLRGCRLGPAGFWWGRTDGVVRAGVWELHGSTGAGAEQGLG